MWGKFSNAGQFCIGSDHVIVVGSPERQERFLAYAKKAADRYAYGGTMARIVNEAHFERLRGLLDGTKGQIVHGGDFSKEELSVGLTIVSHVERDDVLMGDEIFGPLLPVLRVDTLQEGVDLIRETETPLALYGSFEI
jgi:aldehyde dehydrogenase (NAD+)